MSIADRLIARAQQRPPDFVIGGADRPYLRRWWLIPRNKFFNMYLHQFVRSDDDRALHSHPWLFNASILLRGMYIEHVPGKAFVRTQGEFKLRFGRAWHRIELFCGLMDKYGDRTPPGAEAPVWTIFITGPRVREWGFNCNGRFVHWKAFTASNDPGAVGKGCDA